ncbi:MAG: hypothetical protein M1820_001164 [Bogoriella megaspora]|nr:MAG: hypothetical protein M1820_001164 [Bogoriella megaspora]
MKDDKKEAQDKRVERLWRKLDTRKEGHLDALGLKNGLRKINHPLQNADNLLDNILKAVDSNGDGRIQYGEFRTFIEQTEDELAKLFNSIDRDHNGNLDKEELRAAFDRAGVSIDKSKIDRFFSDVDKDHDGVISFDEWRLVTTVTPPKFGYLCPQRPRLTSLNSDFLLFIPQHDLSLRAILSYYSATVKVNPEGDVLISDDAMEGLGKKLPYISDMLFGSIIAIARPPPKPRPPDHEVQASPVQSAVSPEPGAVDTEPAELTDDRDVDVEDEHAEESSSQKSGNSLLTEFLPDPGYFLAGGLAGAASRTSTAPLDRLKVYLIAQTGVAQEAVQAAKKGAAITAIRRSYRPLVDASRELWAAGGMRSLFAGNGLNVIKVMPESAVKFGSYEGSKRLIAQAEGHGDPRKISPTSQFIAGGVAGMISQFAVSANTLKFRMQCETVPGGLHGNALIMHTFRAMWRQSGFVAFYRGLPMGLAGMFPYAALDLGTFEALKKIAKKRNAKAYGCDPSDPKATPGSVPTAFMGGFSGAIGASIVYPLNLLRTRLQSQGTKVHPRTYTGIWDVTQQTIKGEGFRGLFKGLTPNLLKVVPAVSITYVVYEKSKVMLHLK